MARWTPQQVAQLAPDDRAAAAARKLAHPGPWSECGSTDALVWGKCQGSGATPYQVTVDLTGPAFKCSCPSRKFPCKHGLALLFLWVEGAGSVADVDAPPDFAGDWLAQREGRQQQRSARAEPVEPADPAARARRLEDRLALMSAGMAELQLWLTDLVRGGLAAARQQPFAHWDGLAARLVDAQLPGLAERVRLTGSYVHTGPDWIDHLLTEAGRWWCASWAWAGRAELDPDDMGDLRAFIGWPYSSEEIRAGETVADRWLVLGVHRTEEGRLQQQRTWIRGLDTGRTAVVLDFAAVGGTLGVAQVVGSVVEAAVALYPGHGPRRALLGDDARTVAEADSLPSPRSLEDARVEQAGWLGQNPWWERGPVTIATVRLVPAEPDQAPPARRFGPGHLVDPQGDVVAVAPGTDIWSWLARTGGQPVDVFGELEDGRVRPLTIRLDGRLVPV
jgi:hypothetical protein